MWEGHLKRRLYRKELYDLTKSEYPLCYNLEKRGTTTASQPAVESTTEHLQTDLQ